MFNLYVSILCFLAAAGFMVAICLTFSKNSQHIKDRGGFVIFTTVFTVMGLFGSWQYNIQKNYEAVQKTNDQYSAMRDAIVHGDDDAVRMMIGKHLHVNRELAYSHDTLVDWAILKNRIDYLKWFAAAGAKGLEWTASVPDGEAGLNSEGFKAAKARSQARLDALEKQDRLDNLKKLF